MPATSVALDVALKPEAPVFFAFFVAWFAVLALLLATDLDQRLLPDDRDPAAHPARAIASVSGFNPLVATRLVAAVAVALLLPALLYLLSIPFGAGAFGMGDLKLLVGVGLLAGLVRTIVGVFAGTFLAGVVIVALIVRAGSTLRTYIPFGPFLILGAFWASSSGSVQVQVARPEVGW